MKNTFYILILSSLFLACAESKTFKDKDGKEFVAEPYGWANEDVQKDDRVLYQVNACNIFWDIVLFETLYVPVWLTGWQFYEPVKLKPENKLLDKKE